MVFFTSQDIKVSFILKLKNRSGRQWCKEQVADYLNSSSELDDEIREKTRGAELTKEDWEDAKKGRGSTSGSAKSKTSSEKSDSSSTKSGKAPKEAASDDGESTKSAASGRSLVGSWRGRGGFGGSGASSPRHMSSLSKRASSSSLQPGSRTASPRRTPSPAVGSAGSKAGQTLKNLARRFPK
ncbi:MAG: hypothetical protein Q9162_005310 [Coniocarpon cinnabarinum]